MQIVILVVNCFHNKNVQNVHTFNQYFVLIMIVILVVNCFHNKNVQNVHTFNQYFVA